MTARRTRIALAGLIFGFGCAAAPARAATCDIALVLALDVSGSVTHQTYGLQRDATAAALESPAVASAARDGLALSVVMWGSGQHTVLPWRILTTAAEASAAAHALRQVARPEAGMTDLASAIRASVAEFRALPCAATRRVLDISGDGRHSGMPSDLAGAVADARAYDIQINALPVVTDAERDVAEWYREHVTSPSGGFIVAADWSGFARAIRMKLSMEVAGR